MESFDWYLHLAKHTTSAAFVKQEPGVFLLIPPMNSTETGVSLGRIPFVTTCAKENIDPFAGQWRILKVAKREGNPYEDCFSVGRAANCDIVLRVPFVSKLHAHILRNADATYSLRAQSATSPTLVNNFKMEANDTRLLKIGDKIGFGTLRLDFVDAQRLYSTLSDPLVMGRGLATTL